MNRQIVKVGLKGWGRLRLTRMQTVTPVRLVRHSGARLPYTEAPDDNVPSTSDSASNRHTKRLSNEAQKSPGLSKRWTDGIDLEEVDDFHLERSTFHPSVQADSSTDNRDSSSQHKNRAHERVTTLDKNEEIDVETASSVGRNTQSGKSGSKLAEAWFASLEGKAEHGSPQESPQYPQLKGKPGQTTSKQRLDFPVESYSEPSDLAPKRFESDSSLSEFQQEVEIVPRRPVDYTLATFIGDSESMQKLVELGVNFAELEQKYNAAEFFTKLDWDKDIMPMIDILVTKAGLPLTAIGSYVTKNPWIFHQDKGDIQVRINYLESKNFSLDAVARIVVGSKYWLNLPVKTVDARLGWLQAEFKLSGDEVRYVVTRAPKLITFGTGYMQLLRFTFREQFGFNQQELRELLVKDPKLWMSNRTRLEKSFDFLQNTIGFSHRRILEFPRCLRVSTPFIKSRHFFLKSLNRDKYDPEKPNFVSLQALLAPNDEKFCKETAKCPVTAYNRFLKTQ